MKRDWIKESKKLATELKSESFIEESTKILESIESGSTGSEILMALRWTLKEILKANPAFDYKRKKKIEEIVNGITIALGT